MPEAKRSLQLLYGNTGCLHLPEFLVSCEDEDAFFFQL